MYSNNLICEIIKYIDINLNTKITINDLENIFFYNRYYIMKLFKKEMNITIFDYINCLRIYNSMKKIKESNHSLTTVFISNGFYSLEYFSEMFKKITEVSPSVYKKYCKDRYSVNNEDYYKILNASIKLKEIIDRKDRYLIDIKPKNNPVKSLSIFKQKL